MTIQKKSLISTLKATKKANVVKEEFGVTTSPAGKLAVVKAPTVRNATVRNATVRNATVRNAATKNATVRNPVSKHVG